MRRDLADIRLADKVFAPHYVRPLAMTARIATALREKPAGDSEPLVELAAGDIFDVLEIANTYSWGQRRADRIVGYVANDALVAMPAAAEDTA